MYQHYLPFPLSMESTLNVSLPDGGAFLHCGHGLDFLRQLIM